METKVRLKCLGKLSCTCCSEVCLILDDFCLNQLILLSMLQFVQLEIYNLKLSSTCSLCSAAVEREIAIVEGVGSNPGENFIFSTVFFIFLYGSGRSGL